MTKYREIIRLTGLGFSQRNIMASCGVAQKTVVKVQKRARELNLSWPLDESYDGHRTSKTHVLLRKVWYRKTNACLTTTTSTRNCSATESVKSSCGRNTWRTAVLTAMNRSCIHNSAITSNRMSRNDRATMHINRKPGEQVEVDWAGDPATIIDPDTGEILKAYIFVGVMTYSQYAYVEAFLDMKQKSWITCTCPYVRVFWRCCQNTRTG